MILNQYLCHFGHFSYSVQFKSSASRLSDLITCNIWFELHTRQSDSLVSTLWVISKTRNAWIPFGPAFWIGIGPLGILAGPIRRMDHQNGPFFFSLCAAFVGVGKHKVNIRKTLETRTGLTKHACCLKYAFSRMYLSHKDKMHIAKMQCFFQLGPPFIFRLCFLPIAGRSKKEHCVRGVHFRVFFGS